MGLEIPQGSSLVEYVQGRKECGNKLVSIANYGPALDTYVECIAGLFDAPEDAILAASILNSTPEVRAEMTLRLIPSILTNAALCCIKLETYSQAVEYATLALKISRNSFVKAYFRRGTAYIYLRKFRSAVNDFKRLTAVLPKDPDARARLKEAERLFSLERFAEAIAGQKVRKPSETLAQYEWAIDSKYQGPRYVRGQTEPTAELFRQFRDYFCQDHNNRVDKKVLQDIVVANIEYFRELPNVVPVTLTDDESRIIVCGDVHGQYYDLINIFTQHGEPSRSNKYLFNGDFVDRGSFSLEVITLLYVANLVWPDSIYMTRGNHEGKDMTSMYGFSGEIRAKSTESIYELFLESFDYLPLAHTLGASGCNPRVFVVHGGLSTEADVTIDSINKLDRTEDSPLRTDLLWADPQAQLGSSPSKRGVSNLFGPDITKRFLSDNNMDLVVRSHEMMMSGFQESHDGHLVTVFSAPNYCDQMNNLGAVLIFTKENLAYAKSAAGLYEPRTFAAVSNKPNIPAMHYSQLFRAGGMF